MEKEKLFKILFMVSLLLTGIVALTVNRNNTSTNFKETPDLKATYMQAVDDKQDILLVFYKHGCPLCETGFPAVEDKIKQVGELKDNQSVLFVDLESDFGKELVSKYDITRTSTLVVIHEGLASENFFYAEETNKEEYAVLSGDINKAFNHFLN
ncbi:MAG: thioredoxin family protein [Streptococcaceae bacterium]|jgi:thioredoxin-related protein|nr:thioredoxin family protein [Streptococcaceae bacterium]